MTKAELDAIRARDAIAVTFDSVGEHTNVCAAMGDIDRRGLLIYVDELRAMLTRYASECGECAGVGINDLRRMPRSPPLDGG